MFAPMKDALAIASRIKQLRTEKQLTQEGFAKRLGDVTRGAVGNGERGLGIKRDNRAARAEAYLVFTLASVRRSSSQHHSRPIAAQMPQAEKLQI